MVGLIEEVGHAHGVEHPMQMTVAVTDGSSIWAFRYSGEGDSRSLFFSTRMDTLKALWNEVPESHVGIVRPDRTSCCRSPLGELPDL